MDIEETKEVTTPGGHKVVVRNYITGAQRRSFRRVVINLDVDEVEKADKLDQAEDEVIKLVVTSVNGKSEDVVGSVLNLPAEDYDFISKLANDVVQGLDKKKEVTSDTSTNPTSKEEPSA